MKKKVFLINVGVNSGHKGLFSPIFEDKSFEILPIPEFEFKLEDTVISNVKPLTFNDLYCYNTNEKLMSFFPDNVRQKYLNRLAHFDPNFNNKNNLYHDFSYGDVETPRASKLFEAKKGDLLIFLASLVPYQNKKFSESDRNLFFIGFIEIDRVAKYARGEIRDAGNNQKYVLDDFINNAHINHLLSLPHIKREEKFIIFQGSNNSKRFKHAIEINREIVDMCLLDKDKNKFIWKNSQTEQGRISSYLRAARCHFELDEKEDVKRFQLLWRKFSDINEDLMKHEI